MLNNLLIATLFEKSPIQWGLRGDPNLWQAMQTHFAQTPLPADAHTLIQLLEHAFVTLTDHPIITEKHFFIAQFAHGGMSSGLISPTFWRETAVPLLCNRYAQSLNSAD